MPEKKPVKKQVKKAEPASVKDSGEAKEKPVVRIEPIASAPVFVAPEEVDDMEDGVDISAEIDKSLKESAKSDRYFQAIGRRKTAVARIRLFTKGDKEFVVNDKPYQQYFQTSADQELAVASMKKMKCLDKFRVTIVVKGGGHTAQAEAIRHGTARVLVGFNENFRKRLRKAGFLTRDPRMRERKKFGLKRARKSPQWAKR
jgi:small subunit ribosomal protein S9